MAAAMLGGWHDGVAHRSGPHLELPGSSAEHHEHRGFQNCEACKVGNSFDGATMVCSACRSCRVAAPTLCRNTAGAKADECESEGEPPRGTHLATDGKCIESAPPAVRRHCDSLQGGGQNTVLSCLQKVIRLRPTSQDLAKPRVSCVADFRDLLASPGAIKNICQASP